MHWHDGCRNKDTPSNMHTSLSLIPFKGNETMNFSKYVYDVGYKAQLKQELATIAGIGHHNLKDYSVAELIHEVERQKKDYIHRGYQLEMHPTVQDAYLYVNFGTAPIRNGETV